MRLHARETSYRHMIHPDESVIQMMGSMKKKKADKGGKEFQ